MTLDRALLVLLPLLTVTPAVAQTTVTGQPATDGAASAASGGQNAVTRPNTDYTRDGKPASTGALTGVRLEKGANSFTEAEARRRLEKAGFHDVKDLKKDADGIWGGSAMMDGKPANVGLDFKGNVAVR
ncbi:hypothetical protein ACRAWG_29180 [Methylobacterium sp. P31]